MPILSTSDLKQRAGKVLDAARKRPQFIFRDGMLFKLILEPTPLAPRNRPEGYFASDYPMDKERRLLEAAYGRLPQSPDR